MPQIRQSLSAVLLTYSPLIRMRTIIHDLPTRNLNPRTVLTSTGENQSTNLLELMTYQLNWVGSH
jgi:hypothetical protein